MSVPQPSLTVISSFIGTISSIYWLTCSYTSRNLRLCEIKGIIIVKPALSIQPIGDIISQGCCSKETISCSFIALTSISISIYRVQNCTLETGSLCLGSSSRIGCIIFKSLYGMELDKRVKKFTAPGPC